MKNKFDTIKLIGLFGMALGGLAALIGNWATEQQMRKTIEEEVQRRISEHKEEESE